MPDRLHRLERAYRTSISAARALRYARSEAELTAEICRIAIDVAGYRLAWIGYAEGGDARSVRPIAHAGFSDGYVDQLSITWAETEHGEGPTGAAIRTGKAQVVQHIAADSRFSPWRADALKRGYGSSVALPLKDGGLTFGSLNLYAPEPHAFDDEELELLENVAEDLSWGILCARGRVAFSGMLRAMEQLACTTQVERVAASLAHDVNNYLGVVLPNLQLLQERAAESDRPLVDDALVAIERAIALNRNLLRAAARAPVEPIILSPDAALDRLSPAFVRAAGPAVQLRLDLGAEDARVRMDPVALEQIVLNLVVNARDAMTEGGRLEIRTRPVAVRSPLPANHLGMTPGNYVGIRVTDSGPGIPEETIERVFDPFFTTKGALGTGLGLATARGLAHQAGGRITVASTVGEGTTFEVLIPRVD